MPGLPRGELDKGLRVERPVPNTGFRGAGSGQWETVQDPVWASIRDILPSRTERQNGGFNLAARPARVRMDYREDITPDMRFVFGLRIMQIVAGPSEIGRRDGVEFVVEDYSIAGNAA